METHLIPINTAEAVLDPFWDPKLSTLTAWDIESDRAVEIGQQWCYVYFEWEHCAAGDHLFTMRRSVVIPIEHYDRFLVSMVAPEGVEVTVAVLDGASRERSEQFRSDGGKHEYGLDITELTGQLSLEIRLVSNGVDGSGWFNWTGFCNTGRLEDHLAYLAGIGATIPLHIIDVESPKCKPVYGLLFDDSELQPLRRRCEEITVPGELPEPSALVADFLLTGWDTRYSREREHGMNLPGLAGTTAVAGAICGDRSLLKRSAEYAVAEALTPYWDWGVLSRTPGSSFEIRSFVQGVVLEDLALVLDLAGEFLTPSMTDLILRRMAEDGIGNVNFNSWKHEYIHHNNQLAAFSTGRIAAYIVLERHWPRVTPYLELAVDELCSSLRDISLSDGGFVEGPSYFHYTMSRGLPALRYYARARQREFRTVVPDVILASSRFADAVASTVAGQDHVPICDAHATAVSDSLAMLAALMPGSFWTTCYRRKVDFNEHGRSAIEVSLDDQIPQDGPDLSPFVSLPEMRLVSSYRMHNGKPVRLVVLGNRAGAGHTHEDKGSFVLEYAHQTIAMDPGICSYDNPLTSVLKHCQRHNMLVPVGTPGRPRPENPLNTDVNIEASGNATSFHASMDCSPGWEPYYERWTREFESPDPGVIRINDTYKLKQGTGAAFLINTVLSVSIDRSVVTIGDGDHRVVVRALPGVQGLSIEMDELPLPESSVPQRRVSFRWNGTEGKTGIQIELS